MSNGPIMPTLETERLRLRAFTILDLEDFNAYAQKPSIGPNAGWPPHRSMEESKRILLSFIEGRENWAIADKATDRVIGSLGLTRDEARPQVEARSLGYVLDDTQWGMGLMSEAVRRAIRYAFDGMGLEVLSVCHFPSNNRSQRVIEKAGFRFEGTLRRARRLFDGRLADLCCYSLLREEYEASRHLYE